MKRGGLRGATGSVFGFRYGVGGLFCLALRVGDLALASGITACDGQGGVAASADPYGQACEGVLWRIEATLVQAS